LPAVLALLNPNLASWWLLILRRRLRDIDIPHDTRLHARQVAAPDAQIDRLMCELHGLTDDEIALVLALAVTTAPAAFAAGFKAPAGEANQSGRLDTASLYDLGNGTRALYAFSSSGSAFTKKLFWKSAKGRFDAARAKLACDDLKAALCWSGRASSSPGWATVWRWSSVPGWSRRVRGGRSSRGAVFALPGVPVPRAGWRCRACEHAPRSPLPVHRACPLT